MLYISKTIKNEKVYINLSIICVDSRIVGAESLECVWRIESKYG